MLVSCICPTFGRAPDYQHLLEEAIESFCRQDWPDKELIVLNDCPQQRLRCDADQVRVINIDARAPSLGQKYNVAIDLAHGDLICPWEDDDLSLPWRMSRSIELLADHDYYNPRRYWYIDGGGLHHEHPVGVSHNCSMYRREAWQRAGRYPDISGPQDRLMDGRLRAAADVIETVGLAVDNWFYIYRWGISPHHLSAFPDSSGQCKVYYDKMPTTGIEPGHYVLHPHYENDYEAMCRDHLSKHNLM